MAIGDDAAAAGLPVIAGTRDKRLGYSDINATMDEVAREKTARVTAVSGEASARTAADALKVDKANVIIQAATPANIAGTGYSGRIWIKKA